MKLFVGTLKFTKDARKLAAEFSQKNWVYVYLEPDSQNPDSPPEVEIAREKPLPFKPSG